MKVIYVAHPVSGDVPGNLAKAKRIMRALQEQSPTVAIIAPWIQWLEICGDDDSDHGARERGLIRDFAVVAKCDEFWMVGPRVSDGMRREKEAAERAGVKVVDLTGVWV